MSVQCRGALLGAAYIPWGACTGQSCVPYLLSLLLCREAVLTPRGHRGSKGMCECCMAASSAATRGGRRCCRCIAQSARCRRRCSGARWLSGTQTVSHLSQCARAALRRHQLSAVRAAQYQRPSKSATADRQLARILAVTHYSVTANKDNAGRKGLNHSSAQHRPAEPNTSSPHIEGSKDGRTSVHTHSHRQCHTYSGSKVTRATTWRPASRSTFLLPPPLPSSPSSSLHAVSLVVTA